MASLNHFPTLVLYESKNKLRTEMRPRPKHDEQLSTWKTTDEFDKNLSVIVATRPTISPHQQLMRSSVGYCFFRRKYFSGQIIAAQRQCGMQIPVMRLVPQN